MRALFKNKYKKYFSHNCQTQTLTFTNWLRIWKYITFKKHSYIYYDPLCNTWIQCSTIHLFFLISFPAALLSPELSLLISVFRPPHPLISVLLCFSSTHLLSSPHQLLPFILSHYLLPLSLCQRIRCSLKMSKLFTFSLFCSGSTEPVFPLPSTLWWLLISLKPIFSLSLIPFWGTGVVNLLSCWA